VNILDEILAELKAIHALLAEGAALPQPSPPTPEQPPQDNLYMRSIEKTNCRIVSGTNKKGKPIMWLPPIGERVTFLAGEKFWVDPDVLDVDGDDDYYKIVKADVRPDAVGKYCRARDVVIV
jgi:hypothetical protein